MSRGARIKKDTRPGTRKGEGVIGRPSTALRTGALRANGLCKIIYESLPVLRHRVMRTMRVFIVIRPGAEKGDRLLCLG